MERLAPLFKANFDYESELFENRSEPKINKLFEHLFFFCCDKDEILYSDQKYSSEYLEYIKSATGFKNKILCTGTPVNWWGKLFDLEKERELNSKLTSLEVSKLLGCNNSEAFEVNSIDQVKLYLKNFKEVILRSPFERSGRSNLILKSLQDLEVKKEKLKKLLEESSLVIEKYHSSRDFDLGSTFKEVEGKFELFFQIKNLNDSNGVFRGGLLLRKEISSPFLDQIAEEYYNRGARGQIQIDSFRFEGNWNWLCEVNYRKSMGLIVKKLARLCPVANEVLLLVTPSSWLKNFKSHKNLHEVLEDLDGVFPLSPYDSKVFFWLVTADNLEKIHEELLNWWTIISKEGRQFPPVFNQLLED